MAWSNCLFKVAQALMFTLQFPSHGLMVALWCLLQLPHAHLASGHPLGCSSCPPFSLAILPSGWTEKWARSSVKLERWRKKPTCQLQTTQRAAPQLSHASVGGSLWADERARGCSSVCAKKPKCNWKAKGIRFWRHLKKLQRLQDSPNSKRRTENREKGSSCSFQWGYEEDKKISTLQGYCHQLLFLMKIAWQIPSISYSLRGAFLLLGKSGGRMAKLYIISITS